MKSYRITSVLVLISVSIALADDIKTINGKVYKNATVTRVEPDGITVKFSGGLVKIRFTELSEELKQKYHYNPQEAQKFAADTTLQINAVNAVAQKKKEDKEVDRLLQNVRIFAIIKPSHYGRQDTTVSIQEYQKFGPTFYNYEWKKVGEEFTGVIDEPMPEYFEHGDVIPMALYRIGHTNDSARYPLFTKNKEKAKQLVIGPSQ